MRNKATAKEPDTTHTDNPARQSINTTRLGNCLSGLRKFCCVFSLTLLVSNPLWADDTEIFFGRASSTEVQPNVLFVLDGSGSMAWFDCADGRVSSTSCNDGTPNGTNTRLARLKGSLKSVLTNTSNVNVGLMRFSHSNSGGRIIYPINDIDQQMCNGQPCSDDSVFTAQSRTSASGDDATELANGDVSISESTIALTKRVATSNKPVSYEYFEGSWTSLPDFDTLTPVDAGSLDNFSIAPAAKSDYFGFRQRATLLISTPGEYTFSTVSDDGSQVFINGQMVVNNDGLHGMRKREGKITLQPGEHTIVVTYFERTGGVGLTVAWSGPGFSERAIDSFVTPAIGNNAWVGLRFPDLEIPQGATITDARLEFSSVAASDSLTSLIIQAEDATDSAPFTTDSNSISARNRSYNSVSWNAIPKWEDGGSYESPNISSLLQLVVNKTGWCGGNALGLIIKGGGERLIATNDSGASTSPALRVSYTLDQVPANGGCTKTTLLTRVSSSADDGTERQYNGWSYGTTNAESFLAAAKSTSRTWGYDSAVRYPEVNIPNSAKIIDATLTLVTDNLGWYSSYPPLKISADNSANPVQISTQSNNITGRSETSIVNWNNIPTTSGTEVVSPSLKGIVQGLVNKSDWDSGNPMVFMIKQDGNGGHNFVSYDKNPSQAALLKIVYESNITSAQDKITGPVTDARTEIINAIDSMVAYHGTPTVGALLEAKRYFSGQNVKYGLNRYSDTRYTSSPYYWGRYSRISHEDSYTGGRIVRNPNCNINAPDGQYCATEKITGQPVYISPFTHECQTNHIVLLTDGQPTADYDAAATVRSLTGGSCVDQPGGNGTCGEEIAEFMNNNDQHTSSGDQFITTHTIGFNFSTQWLKNIAAAGGGGYYTADSASELSSALGNIINSVQDEGSTFVAPGATVDNFSKISHRTDIYLALFQPSATPDWGGNLKRFDYSGNPATLHDKNSNPAIDPDTGLFFDSSQSYWSASPDGNAVEQGGAASRMAPANRNVYTNIGSSAFLTHQSNEFSSGNALITTAKLNLAANDTATRNNILNWALGYDIKDDDGDNVYNESRQHIGDPLHARPVIVTYGGSTEDPESVIYFSTNDGFIHAINTDTGDEVFSFIPSELLSNLKPLYESNPARAKIYGLDGPMSLWTEDSNDNGIIESEDHVYLYAGMRRGGNSYYALDITDKDDPEFKWHISNSQSGFAELGQTWSQALPTSISYLGAKRKVLVFGGGYDVAQDDHTTRTEDRVGRALYIVDADDGELLWSGGPKGGSETKTFDEMTYSFPATPAAIDSDGDGMTEQLYIGDMGGRIWRFDVNETTTDQTKLIDGGIVADLGSDRILSDARRFYHTPDISASDVDGERVINIAVGSGFQAHPLDSTIEDRFYLIRYPFESPVNSDGDLMYGIPDTAVYGSAATPNAENYTPILESDLFDATSNVIGEGEAAEAQEAEQELADSHGWLIRMEKSGEKILGASVTFDNKVLFASYVPGSAPTGCAPEIGHGIFWAVNLWDATPASPESDDDDLIKEDRTRAIPGGGIPAPVQTLFIESGNVDENGNETDKTLQVMAISGANKLATLDSKDLIKRVYWSEYPNF